MTNARQDLHDAVDRLSDEEVRHLSATLGDLQVARRAQTPRPLTKTDIVLAAPVLADDETADEMIETVRRWRSEGGYA